MRAIITTKQQLKEVLQIERKQYNLTKFSAFINYYIFNFESAIIWHWQKRLRLTEYYFNSKCKILYLFSRIKLNKLLNKYMLHIPTNVCGKGLKIMHLGAILCNGGTVIGENCSIHINTSFVARGTSGDCPVIGNNVVIGIGSTVLGGVDIADGIAVGACSLVNKVFNEPNITIAGIPARKISNTGRSCWNNKKTRNTE